MILPITIMYKSAYAVPCPDEKGGRGAVTSSLKNLGSAGPADSTLEGRLIQGYRMSLYSMLGAAAPGICSSCQRVDTLPRVDTNLSTQSLMLLERILSYDCPTKLTTSKLTFAGYSHVRCQIFSQYFCSTGLWAVHHTKLAQGTVQHGFQHIVEGLGTSLEWAVNTCQTITQEYQEVFEGIGCLKGYEYEAKFQTSDMNM
ncbi:hypothetical protein LAZ67_7003561 [Cordylochernes scorpioides]|uniref:Uncharacterized protein n=1 Tax=Cordylochernes scorpioides TaxID=51811 RepID=A0ABY6KNY2_9ARAC|nr:hypothetical protein LAZ67_7003561 [Cordylochernes scorpioides]